MITNVLITDAEIEPSDGFFISINFPVPPAIGDIINISKFIDVNAIPERHKNLKEENLIIEGRHWDKNNEDEVVLSIFCKAEAKS